MFKWKFTQLTIEVLSVAYISQAFGHLQLGCQTRSGIFTPYLWLLTPHTPFHSLEVQSL